MQAVLAAGTPRRSNLAHSPALCPTSALAAIGGGTSTCAGASLTLSAASLAHLSASPYTYAWTLVSGDGLPAATTAPTLTVTPTQSSVYRLTLGLPGQSCTASATLAVAVLPAVWTGAAGDGNWFTAGNWQGCVPTRTTDATIPAGLATPYPTIAGGTAEVRTLTQPGSLAITGGELDLYGDFFTGAGTFSHTGGQVVAMGTGGQALRSGTYYDLAIAGTGNKTIPTATITNRLLMQGGVLSTVTVNSTQGLVTLTPTATLVGENDNSFVLGAIQTTRTVGTTPEAFGNLGARIMASFAPGATTVLRTTDQSQPLGAAQRISRYYDIAATTGGGLQGATLALAYLPHELNGLAPDQLTLFKSTTGGATWTNEGATTRDASAGLVTRAYATSLNGRWTLAPASSGLAPAAVAYAIQAYPVPFTTGGLSLQVTTPTAGPLTVQLYDAAGRAILNQAVADVEVGTSTINLTNSELLAPGKYIVRVQQAAQRLTLNVVRE